MKIETIAKKKKVDKRERIKKKIIAKHMCINVKCFKYFENVCYIKIKKNWHWSFIKNNINNWIQNYIIDWIVIVTKFINVLKKFFKKIMFLNIVENVSFNKEEKQVFDSSLFTIAIFVRIFVVVSE